MAKIGVIGGGAFGTAMACVVRRAGNDVTMWAREPEVVESINRDGENRAFLPGVAMVKGIVATGNLEQAVSGMDFLLMVAPAQHQRSVAGQLAPFLARGTPVVNCSKGVERGSCALMPEVLAEMLPGAVIAVLSGPSFAREIAVDLPCGVTLACADPAVRELLCRHIGTDRFRTYRSFDIIGAAIGGVMKNVISIASGIVAGKKLGENARATLITRGLVESTRLGVAKGAHPDTFLGLCGVGDLMLTANSLQSRNTSLGVAIGEGRKAADVLAARKEVTEGAFSTEAVAQLAAKLGIDMPITQTIDAVLNHGADLDASLTKLIHHPYHDEIEAG
jgi:glycerol-3-phosphate dehydrogenase (NAD(P)+)